MTMESTKPAEARIWARDRALALLNNITTYVAFAAVAGVGIFGTVSALTIPGVSASSSGATASTAASTSSDLSSSSSSSSSSSGLSSSSGSVSSSSSSGVAVSGGS
jgi:hypothetical protein